VDVNDGILTYFVDPAGQPSDVNVGDAQDMLLQQRAYYVLRKDVVDNVMMANPILKSVHNSTNASPVERYGGKASLSYNRAYHLYHNRDILPYVQQRDDASIALGKQSRDYQDVLNALSRVQTERLSVSRRNVELTTELLRLAQESHKGRTGDIDNPELQARMQRLQTEVKASRQKWKIMKGTASAVVTGSGVDWVRDAELREIVLDEEEEG
jgi:hypothetical protein